MIGAVGTRPRHFDRLRSDEQREVLNVVRAFGAQLGRVALAAGYPPPSFETLSPADREAVAALCLARRVLLPTLNYLRPHLVWVAFVEGADGAAREATSRLRGPSGPG
ncbi:MAG: hypothetical protein R3A52_16180 [Polyangiales bacterium]